MAWDARNLISTQVGTKTHPDDAEPTEIWPTNAKVNAVNRQGLERLKNPPKRFEYAYEAVWKSTSASGANFDFYTGIGCARSRIFLPTSRLTR